MAARASLREYQRELAERLRNAGSAPTASRLGFQVGEDNWLVELSDAAEVIPVPAITSVPLTRPWFRGVTNIRGNLYSVVDFAAFVGGAAVKIGDESRLIVVSERFRMASALLVDRSLGLRNPAQLQQHAGRGARHQWAKTDYTDSNGRTWRELDVPHLVRHPEFLGVAA